MKDYLKGLGLLAIPFLLLLLMGDVAGRVGAQGFGAGGLELHTPIANSPVTFYNPNGVIFQISGAPNPVTWVVATSEIHGNPGVFGHGTAAYPDPGMNLLTDCATDYKPVDIIGGNEPASDWLHAIGPCGPSDPLEVRAGPQGHGVGVYLHDVDGSGIFLGANGVATKRVHTWLEQVAQLPQLTIPSQSVMTLEVPVQGAQQDNVSFCSPVGADPGGVTWSSWSPAANTVQLKIANSTGSVVTVPALPWACDVIN